MKRREIFAKDEGKGKRVRIEKGKGKVVCTSFEGRREAEKRVMTKSPMSEGPRSGRDHRFKGKGGRRRLRKSEKEKGRSCARRSS